MHILSISLGSSKRNHRSETTLLGRRIVLERIGTDGDQRRARQLFVQMDGQVDAFGVGGTDLRIRVGGRDYPIRAVQHLVQGLKTPAVDGGVVRAVFEREIAKRMEPLLGEAILPKQVMIATAVARYDMACSFVDAAYQTLFGDLGFGLGLPLPIRNLPTLERLGRLLLPVMSRLPFEWLYPTGAEQEKITPKFESWYRWATVIADDFHYIKRHLPARLEGKTVVTNTTTPADIDLLRMRGVRYLVTSTPRVEGRTFGTNVLEAALVAIAGKGRALTPAELRGMLQEEDLKPTVLPLQSARC